MFSNRIIFSWPVLDLRLTVELLEEHDKIKIKIRALKVKREDAGEGQIEIKNSKLCAIQIEAKTPIRNNQILSK